MQSTTVSHLKAPETAARVIPPDSSTLSINDVRRNFVAEGMSVDLHQDDSDLVPLPMNNLYSLTEPGNSRLIRVDPADTNGPDFISRGVVSIMEAKFLFNHFRDHINPLLWSGILCSHQTLQEARQSSSLLVATVLTVAALHMPNREASLHATYNAFVSLMRGTCLLRTQNMDDIRGLCIGAFYLTSLSWALCSRAVRMATEMNLHKSSLQFSRGSLDSYERVRLWYVLYVCDHQFALAYGRPPMMREDAAIRNADKLLSSGLSGGDDRQLVAQVKLFRILAESYFTHGCGPDLELSAQDFYTLQSFNVSTDQWRLEEHREKFIMLYYHLARFQLNSVSLRGVSAKDTRGLEMSWDRQEAANNAISAATNTLRLIIEDGCVQSALIGMPIFVHAMVAVCASFLLKMAVVFGKPRSEAPDHGITLPKDLHTYGLHFHTNSAMVQVNDVVRTLDQQVAARASQRHVASQVVTGLKELLERFSPSSDDDGAYVYVTTTSTKQGHFVPLRSSGGTTPAPGENDYVHGVIPKEITNSRQGNELSQPLDGMDQYQDPFNLIGDLDWRFNDSFLWGFDMDSHMPS